MVRYDLSRLTVDFPEEFGDEVIFQNFKIKSGIVRASHPSIKELMPICSVKLAFAEGNDVVTLGEKWYDSSVSKKRVLTLRLNTLLAYRGNGLIGRVIEMANEEVKQRYGVPISSSGGVFLLNDRPLSGFAYYPGMRVFEKLELEGKATYIPLGRKARWVMK